jgi:hypothetical protein
MIQSLTGKDTIKIDDRILNDLADGDIVDIEFPNNIAAVKTGKDGNSIYAFNETGKNCNVTLRVMRGSSDDKYMQSRFDEMIADFSKFITLNAQFIKRVGDGSGNVGNDIYRMSGGVFIKEPAVKTNVEGATEQSVTIYNLSFSNAPRQIA